MKWRRFVRHNRPTWKADIGPFRCVIFMIKPVFGRRYYEVLVNSKDIYLPEQADHVLYDSKRYPKLLKQAKAVAENCIIEECHNILDTIHF